MDRHSSNATFISEIPVRCLSSTGNDIKWIGNLTNHTTVRDIIQSVVSECDSSKYSLYIHTDRKKQMLKESSRIYKIVAKVNQQKFSHRLLFEIQLKKIQKRVRFADEIIVQNIVQRQCVSNDKVTKNIIETISIPFEKRLENLKENFQKHIHKQQENYIKTSKRSSLKIINENIPRSPSESGISSIDSLILETLV